MPAFELKVTGVYAPKRLDVYLREALEGKFSRQELKDAIDKGFVFLNGQSAKPKNLVKDGDVVSGDTPLAKTTAVAGENIPLKILYEDDWLLVIDKPAGMVVHPGAGNKKGTLVHALVGRGSPLSSLGGDSRPGIVHRLDKDTSGLLLVAKNNEAHRRLQEQFASRTLSKTYLALVKGKVEFEEGRVTASIGRDPKTRLKMAVSSTGEARHAETHYRVLKRFRHSTFLEIKILTGRTHQIRVHLKHLGHPVLGDAIYGATGDDWPRLGLHASKIEFEHPKTGKMMRLASEVPEEFKKMIERAESK